MRLTKEEIPKEVIEDSKIFHFGTLSMTHEGVREATKKALKMAKEAGVMISFDPNLRPPLWENLEIAREQVLYGLTFCDILKISDNEIQWLTGEEDYTLGVYPHDIFILIFSGNSHFSLSVLQKDEDNIFILNHRFVPFLLHHQATAVFHLLTFCRIPLLCASFPLKEPRKCG